MAQLTAPQVTLAGNLTRDPELRYTQSGQAVCSFSVASTPRAFDKDKKEYVDGTPVFTNCVLWGKPGENFAASAVKGSRVLVAGVFKSREYQDKEDNKRTATELVCDEVGMSVMFASYTKGAGVSASAPAEESWGQGFPQAGDETPF